METVRLEQVTRMLKRYMLPHARRVAWLGLCLFAMVAFQLFAPKILQLFIDAARAGATDTRLLQLAGLFLVFGIGTQVFSAIGTWLGSDLGWRATNRMRQDLAAHALSLDLDFHAEQTPGGMVERIDGDVTALSTFFSKLFLQLASGILLTIGVVVMLMREHLVAGGILALFAGLSMFVVSQCRMLGVKQIFEHRKQSAALFGMIEERLAGLEDIRANRGGDYVMDSFYRGNRTFYRISRIAWMLRTVVMALVTFLFATAEILALAIGGWLFLRGAITLGTVFLFYTYTRMLRMPIQRITHQIQDLQKAFAAIGRVDELRQTQSAMRDGTGPDLPPAQAGTHSQFPIPNSPFTLPPPPSLELRNVHFEYEPGTPVLRGINVHVRPGTSLGLLGRTGSGKTTLIRLLCRLFDPQSGSLHLDGRDLRDIPVDSLRQHVAMVTQDVRLFQASVRDNLTFFDATISDERVWSVLDTLGLRDWVGKFPQGIDTPLLGSGMQLSAGESQLLALARVFLREPSVVLLDEPSSRLDPHTERLLQHAIDVLLEGRTVVIIAHRLDTVRGVDDILVLDAGRVLEHGPRKTLAADPTSRFHALLDQGLEEALA